MPAVLMLVPPLVTLLPATLSCFVQFAALVVRSGAMATMLFNSLVKFVLGVDNPALAVCLSFGIHARSGSAKRNCKNGDGEKQLSDCFHPRPPMSGFAHRRPVGCY